MPWLLKLLASLVELKDILSRLLGYTREVSVNHRKRKKDEKVDSDIDAALERVRQRKAEQQREAD